LFEQFNKYIGKDGVAFSINRVTLAFQDGVLEKTFKQSYFGSNIHIGRACHLIAIFFYWIVGMWDAIVIDPFRMNIWAWVIPSVTIIFLAGLASSYLAINWYAKYWQQLFAFYVFMTGTGFTIVTVLSSPNYPVYNFVGIIFCLLFCYTFIRLTFIWASIAGNVIIAMYMFATIAFWGVDTKNIFSGFFYMLGVNLLGMMVCYSLELMSRRDFMLKNLLELEKEKTEHMNNKLEQMVQERTEELRVSEETFIGFFSHGNIGMAIMSTDKGLLNVNKKLCDMLGYSEEELLGKSWTEISYEEDVKADLFKLNQMLSGEIDGYQLEKRFIRKDKGVIHSHLTVSCTRHTGGSVEKVLATIQDITDRKQVEDKLKENEQKYRHLIETASDAIYLISENGQFIDVNQAACKMLSRNKEEFFKVNIDSIDLNFSVEAFTEFWRETPINTPRIFETAHLRKDGTLISVEVSGQKFKIGEKIVFFGIARDITDRKKAQSERDELQKKLTQSQKLESIGNLAGGIAHDFNNILSVIIGYTEFALDETNKGTPLEDSLQEVYSAGKRAKDLVKQILAFARRTDEKRNPIQASLIVTEVLKFIRSTIPTTIEIREKIESESLILGNVTQLHQVLMNLCTNAAYAMEDSGGILEVAVKDTFLHQEDTIPDMQQGKYIEIKISDTGAGIAPEIIESVFEPYFTTKKPGEGTGLGLAVVHGIVKSYGGRVKVESKLGEGTIFTICLPITKNRSIKRAYVPEQLPTGTERILYVDDEAAIAKMAKQTLERLGYLITTRTNSIEALELFQMNPNDFDLVITDMTMPNMTGSKLAIELMKIRPDIPVILCTGYSKQISDETASEIGIKAFAYKPMVIADIAKTVRKVLEG